MEKDIIIERLVYLMKKNDLLFKAVVNYVNSAYNGCLTDTSMEEKWKSQA